MNWCTTILNYDEQLKWKIQGINHESINITRESKGITHSKVFSNAFHKISKETLSKNFYAYYMKYFEISLTI